jgi:hypothetical protein
MIDLAHEYKELDRMCEAVLTHNFPQDEIDGYVQEINLIVRDIMNAEGRLEYRDALQRANAYTYDQGSILQGVHDLKIVARMGILSLPSVAETPVKTIPTPTQPMPSPLPKHIPLSIQSDLEIYKSQLLEMGDNPGFYTYDDAIRLLKQILSLLDIIQMQDTQVYGAINNALYLPNVLRTQQGRQDVLFNVYSLL